jgi:phage tail-like protein
MDPIAVPVAFHFSVTFADEASPKTRMAFQEVSGLEAGLDVETVTEGGGNQFVHKLPKQVKHPNLKLKRGLSSMDSAIVKWCKSTLEDSFAEPITTKSIVVELLDETGTPVASWSVQNAYPVKWSVGAFDAMKNDLAIEAIELSYTTVTRTL